MGLLGSNEKKSKGTRLGKTPEKPNACFRLKELAGGLRATHMSFFSSGVLTNCQWNVLTSQCHDFVGPSGPEIFRWESVSSSFGVGRPQQLDCRGKFDVSKIREPARLRNPSAKTKKPQNSLMFPPNESYNYREELGGSHHLSEQDNREAVECLVYASIRSVCVCPSPAPPYRW